MPGGRRGDTYGHGLPRKSLRVNPPVIRVGLKHINDDLETICQFCSTRSRDVSCSLVPHIASRFLSLPHFRSRLPLPRASAQLKDRWDIGDTASSVLTSAVNIGECTPATNQRMPAIIVFVCLFVCLFSFSSLLTFEQIWMRYVQHATYTVYDHRTATQ